MFLTVTGFALRRGIPAAVLQSNVFNEAQASAVDTALRLGTFPSTMTRDSRDILYEAHSADDVEWIIMAIAMMGFLQKFADTCVCQLEAASYDLAGDFLTSLYVPHTDSLALCTVSHLSLSMADASL